MKSLVGVVAGALLAGVIACGGASSPATRKPGPDPMPPPSGGGARSELDALDQAITADMQKLGEARPTPPAATCAGASCAQAMSGAAKTATADDATCKPGTSQTCTESCSLKESICKNAGKICSIAADLGGNDAYANETCNRGSASCEAAKRRCCSCL